jgi:hypothetical protein
MEGWHVGVALGLVVTVPGALYGLHRLCLWLEARGLLYYWHKKPSSSASCFVPLLQAFEPASQHVYHIKEEKRHPKQEEGGGQRPDREPLSENHTESDGNTSPLTE